MVFEWPVNQCDGDLARFHNNTRISLCISRIKMFFKDNENSTTLNNLLQPIK